MRGKEVVKATAGTKTLRNRILLSLLAIIILQVMATVLVIWLTGTKEQLDSSAEQMLANTVNSKRDSLQDELLKWADIDDAAEAVGEYVNSLEAEYGMPAAQLMKDKEVRKNLLTQSSEILLGNLRQTGATGTFLILREGAGRSRKAALYLRDLNPNSTPSSNYDILIEAGGGQSILEKGFTLDNMWSLELPIGPESEFYHKPIEAAETNPGMEAKDCGYFSGTFRLRENDIEIITYTIPMLDRHGTPYAVLGVEIGSDYLKDFIPGKEIGVDKNAAFFIGIARKEGELENVLIEGRHFQSRLNTDPLQLKDLNSTLTDISFTGQEQKALAYIAPMKLYNTNTPFEQEQWVLSGLVHQEALYSSSNRLLIALFAAIVLALIISILGAVSVTAFFVRPIRTLMADMKNKGGRKVRLPRTNIREIDELSAEIERLNENTFRAGSKVADIIEASSLQLGIYEMQEDEDQIFCTKQVFTMLHIPMEYWQENYVNREDFEREIENVKLRFLPQPVEEDTYCYLWEQEEHYIRFREAEDGLRKIHILMDVTAEVLDKQKIKHDRDYDVLTNLLNRRAFSREMNNLLEQRACRGALLSVWDLDNLKYINDTYGHDLGDKYICLLADVFMNNQQESMICARMSGDEFMMFSYLTDREENYRRIHRIHASFLEHTLSLPDGKTVSVSASAGTVEYGTDGVTYAELVRYADFAMYEAKNLDKGSIRAFTRDSYIKDYLLVQGVGELNRILKDEDIRYAFQPIFDVKKKAVFAYEALMRPGSDILMNPDELLRIAASQSRLKQVEFLTWFLSLRTYFSFRLPAETKLFINSLPDQCLSEDEAASLTEKYGSRLSCLVIEVTERSRLNTVYEERKQEWSRRWGAQIALDDFGSGYSNPEFLVTRELHYIKLDRSLVQDIHIEPSRQKFVSGIIEYCHENHILVIAEGVEIAEEYQETVRLGCDFVQGYYLARPSFEPLKMTEEIIEKMECSL